MTRQVLVLLICAIGVCACSSENEPAEAPRPEPRVAEVDLTIGVAEGREPYMFGWVSGVALDDRGRVYVTDQQAHEVRVFDDDGTFLFAIGGQGEGPGQLNRPCCPAFGPKGHLWLRDEQNRRFVRYRVEGKKAVPAGQIRMDHSHFGLRTATTFDEEGRLISVGGQQRKSGLPRTVRRHRTMENETVRTQLIPEAPADRVPEFEFETDGGGTVRYSQPMGPRAVHAHGPDGDWAFSITDRYEVVRLSAAGDTLHVIERTIQGPELSSEEQKRVEKGLQRIAEQAGMGLGGLPFGVPDRKPPINNLFFDGEGRLWVQRSVADTTDLAEADVYDPSGNLVEVVRWPHDVDLGLGVIRDSVAYGLRGGAETPPKVVRLRY